MRTLRKHFAQKKKGTEIEVCFLKTYADFNAMDISSWKYDA